MLRIQRTTTSVGDGCDTESGEYSSFDLVIFALCLCSDFSVEYMADLTLPCATSPRSCHVRAVPFSTMMRAPRWCSMRDSIAFTFLLCVKKGRHAYEDRVVKIVALVAVISCT